MKIIRVEIARSLCRSHCWILLATESGLVGFGETYYRADPTETITHKIARVCVLGSESEYVEKIRDMMYRRASLLTFR